MAQLIKKLLIHYDENDYLNRQQAEAHFILYFIIAIGLAAMGISMFAIYRAFHPTHLGVLLCELILLVSVYYNYKGKVIVAGYWMLFPLNIILWYIIWIITGVDDTITVVDSIFYVFTLIATTTLISNRTSVVIFTLFNVIAHTVYSIHFFNAGIFN